MVKFIIEVSEKEKEAIKKSKKEVKAFFKKLGSAFQFRVVHKSTLEKNKTKSKPKKKVVKKRKTKKK